jgi:TonB family protein
LTRQPVVAVLATAMLWSSAAHAQSAPETEPVQTGPLSDQTVYRAPPAPAPPPTLAQRPRLRSAVQNLVTSADYPPVSARTEEEGRVSVILSVGLTGRAGGCFVRESSGSERLDVRTCSTLMRRARYVPATDATGQPTLGEYPHIVNWRLPDPEPVLDKAGNMVQPPPRPVPASGPVQPNPTALIDLSVTPHSAPAVLTPGQRSVIQQMVRLTVGINGRAQQCEPVGYVYPDFAQSACADYSALARFNPAMGADNQPVVSSIYAALFFSLPPPSVPAAR